MSEMVEHVMDVTGLLCPEPVMMLHAKVKEIKSGEIIKVIASDPSTLRDIPKFCTFLGHKLISNEEVGSHFIYLIEKE